ncbi:hypothetical protein Ccrd_020556 [Cynara cardunculus var. scolymus]|uniref:Epidermal patterning factor-like protein n=1 Tax=Cynara cardunculus var. scolymus TaxID=59895 RepID=A0A118K0H3_CYNCS|nr:hypothetical protein Ccrd_020556 [Cynara cardunculus var. scolymus]
MDKRIWLMMMMMMMSCASASASARARHMGLLEQGQLMQSPFLTPQPQEGIGLSSRVGSRPPRCEHKCKGCSPCSPIEVPTAHLGPQYANYEPEGWKCECGSVFFNP